MSIGVDCPGCRTSFRVDPQHAGKVGQCPRCREEVRVPRPARSPAAAAPEATPPAAGPSGSRRAGTDLLLDGDDAEIYGLIRPAAAGADVAARLRAAKAARAEAAGNPAARPDPAPGVSPGSSHPVVRLHRDGKAEAEDGYGLVTQASADVSARLRAAQAARSGRAEVATEAPPAGPAARPAPSSRPTRPATEILAAFRGEIKRVRPTAAYRAWIVVIAAVMLILPAIYVGLIGLVAAGVYWHATHSHEIFAAAGTNRLTLVAYVAPLVAGLMVVAFLLKPLFARAPRRGRVRRIDPAAEPLLFAFVDGVCSSVGAPRPSRIEVDCEVNASAHLATWALSPARELVLTIGLPLVAGLSLRQFTGVLAHEFGHFAQGAGMRLSVLIRSINHWFARVVYERDEWDETLLEWSSVEQGGWMVFGLAIRGAVWAARRVLWVLMHVARLVSGFLSRQMEFDADRYATRMVGGKTFRATAERLGHLDFASAAAHGDLANHWRERRLPDDLARLILVKQAEFPPELLAAVRAGALSARTGLFDTHPCDADRVARALAEEAPGIFKLGGPATDLFRDFDALSRAATFDHYRARLGREVRKEQLYPIAEALLNRAVEREGDRASDRFFLGALPPTQPIALPASYPAPPSDLKGAKQRLGELRAAMLRARQANLDLAGRWGEAVDREARSEAAVILFKVDKAAPAGLVDLPRATLAAAEAARDAAEAAATALLAELDAYSALAAERLALALGLLELDPVVARVPDGAVRRDEARALYPAASLLGGRVVGELGRLAPALGAFQVLVGLYQSGKNQADQALINAVIRGTRLVHERLTTLKWKVGDAVAYPFEHAQEGIGLGRFALPFVPGADEPGDLFQAAGEARDRLLDLNRRVLGRLAATAQAVERTLGLPPVAIPAPTEPEPEPVD